MRIARPATLCLVTLAILLAPLVAGASGFANEPGAVAPPAPPVISHYSPLPASHGDTITIHGAHLASPAAPHAPAATAPKTQLYWGAVGEGFGRIDGAQIVSWTDSAIQVSGLEAPEGVWGIVIVRGGAVISNYVRTLAYDGAPPDPEAVHTLSPGAPPVERRDAAAADFFAGNDDLIQAVDRGPNVVDPNAYHAYVAGYAPSFVGAEDEIVINGYFPLQPEHLLIYGIGDKARSIHTSKIKNVHVSGVVLHPAALPMGAWWVAAATFDPATKQFTLVSNRRFGLQVTESAPSSGPGSLQKTTRQGAGESPPPRSAPRMREAGKPRIRAIAPAEEPADAATRVVPSQANERVRPAAAPAPVLQRRDDDTPLRRPVQTR